MKLSSVVPLGGFASLTVLATELSDAANCLVKHPNIYQAIGAFCGKTDIVVPSTYANAGKVHNGKWVGIAGNCK
jgi:hypothetical protein